DNIVAFSRRRKLYFHMKQIIPSAETIRLLSLIPAREGHDELVLQYACGLCPYDVAFFPHASFVMHVPVRPIRTALKHGWIITGLRCPGDLQDDIQRGLTLT